MDENELEALLQHILSGGLAEDQQGILAQQMQEALGLKHTEQPGFQHANGVMFAASPLANIAATLRQVKGGQQEQAIRGPTPLDPATGQPISQYGNLATAQAGVGAQLQQKIAEFLRQRKAAQAYRPPQQQNDLGPVSPTNNPYSIWGQ